MNGKGKCDVGKCKPGFFYDSPSMECYEEGQNCKESIRIHGKTVCKSCKSSKFTLSSSGDCLYCGNGCLSCSYNSILKKPICSSCQVGFFIKNDECKKCSEGCESCNSEIECKVCQPKYVLIDKLCSRCKIDKCESCKLMGDGSNLECLTCSENNYLNDGNCGKCPPFCLECKYNGKFQCTKCMKEFGLASDGQCLLCPSNCKSCIIDSRRRPICKECISDEYLLENDGSCKECSKKLFDNCERCYYETNRQTAVCRSCVKGFDLDEEKKTCKSCSIGNCKKCFNGNLCRKCKSGFILNEYSTECLSE